LLADGTPVKIQCDANGYLKVDATGILENPPTEDEDKKAPTSEWAFDHDADASAHHARYTNSEARGAINDLFDSSGNVLFNMPVNRKWLLNVEALSFSGESTGPGAGVWYYNSYTALFSFLGKDRGGSNQNVVLRVFNGTVYTSVIREDTFQANLALFLENPPTEDEDEKAPTSEWAFDHAANAAAHHAKYTDAEAVAAQAGANKSEADGTYTALDVTGKRVCFLETTGGNVNIQGLTGGVSGQVVFFIKPTTTNVVNVYHNHASGDEKIMTFDGSNMSLGAGNNGGFIALFDGADWFIIDGLY